MSVESTQAQSLPTREKRPAPSSKVRLTPFTVRCSSLDALLQNIPVGVTFTFEERLDPEPLLQSLQTTLESFPVFAGRLRLHNNQLYIDCKDQGISANVVELEENLTDELERLATGASEGLCKMISPSRALKGKSPLLTIRFNQPRDRGTILGICWHHSVGDMATLMELMLAWAAHTRGETFPTPIIPVDRHATYIEAIQGRGPARSGIRRLGNLQLLRFLAYMIFSAKKQERACFYFSDAELEAMRADLSEKAGHRLTRNDALCAHLAWSILPLDPVVRPHTLAFSINWRSRLSMPAQLLGNFIGGILVPVAEQADAAELAGRIRHSVDNSIDEHLDYVASHEQLERGGGHSAAARHLPLGIDPMTGTLLITSWCRFGVNQIEFQGQPCRTFNATPPPFPWLSSIFEGPRNEGMTFAIALPPAMGKSLKTMENINRVHKYRRSDDSIPLEISRIKAWL